MPSIRAGGTVDGPGPMSEPLLCVEGLRTSFHLEGGVLRAVNDVSFALEPGRVLGIVGESGSGKSVTALSILRLVDPPGRIEGGRIRFRGRDLLDLSEAEMEREIRGDRIGMIFQDPMTSLNPVFPVGVQIAEVVEAHQNATREESRRRAIELLGLVGIPHPEDRFSDYPHHFSGGMRQRVLIAAAIASQPDILIADEPTTALDVTIQAQILGLLGDLQRRFGTAMVLITHDLGVIATMADDVMVMYAGRAVEQGSAQDVFERPRHPYTQGLFDSLIRLDDSPHSELRPIPGNPPVPIDLPPGCSFRPRCRHAMDICGLEAPSLLPGAGRRRVACHLASAQPASPAA